MAFGSDVRMCMWSDIPPISMGMAFKPRITPPIYWNMRGKSSLRIFLPLFFTWKIMCMSIFTNELAMIILVVSVALSGLYL